MTQTQLLAQKALQPLCTSLSRKVIDRTGSTGSFVVKVNEYLQLPKIRESKKELIAVHVTRVAKIYGATKDIGGVVAECVRIAKNKFGFLAPQEIREAYENWALNPEIGRSAEMYGGQLNALNFGRVLSAYVKHRNKVAAAIKKEIEQQKEEIAEERRKIEMQSRFNADFEKTLANLKETVEDWRDVPEYVFRVLRTRDQLPGLKENWQTIWDDAKGLAKLEIQNRKEDGVQNQFHINEVEPVRKRIARKIAVFRLVIKK